MAATAGARITLSLISHTNVGKTTLARTLLRQDIGEVRDQAHVTDASSAHVLIDAAGDTLLLWDTPGFGDTARLIRRLRRENDPVGWFLHQVWDRFVDRALWCSQAAVQNVREDADVVLYLVNAAEEPGGAGYVEPELELLGWIGRPVLLLLNQVGPGTGAGGETAVESWRAAVRHHEIVRDVLSLDAFTRCWVEETTLLNRVAELLEGDQRAAMERLTQAWDARNEDAFGKSCRSMGAYLARAATDREVLSSDGGDGLLDSLSGVFKASPLGKRQAMRALATRLDASTGELMQQLIAAHELYGDSAEKIEQRVQDFQVRGFAPLNEKSGALAGAVISGALGGLAADALSGGLTLGGGMIAGGILGALGGAGLARGYRLVGGTREPSVRWSAEFLDQLVHQVVLRYLAVAHFGRGRGDYRDIEQPAHWKDRVDDALRLYGAGLENAWGRADADNGAGSPERDLTRVIQGAARAVLTDAYPPR